MQLIYRGITFNYTPSQSLAHRLLQQIRQSEATHSFMYRGMTFRTGLNTKVEPSSEQFRIYELLYRGMKYSVNHSEQGEVIIITATAIAPPQQPVTSARTTNLQVQPSLHSPVCNLKTIA